jgi:predicted peptidase
VTGNPSPIARIACAGLAIGAAALLTRAAEAPGPFGAFEHHTFISEQGAGAAIELPYRLLPPIDPREGERYPLIVFLHGFGERGADNERQLSNGGAVLADEAFRRERPAFVIAPQCPDGIEPSTGRDRAWIFRLQPGAPATIELDRDPTPQLAAVHALVESVCETHAIDRDRIYLMGLSMGGYAVWELAMRHPNTYAAAVPICGAGDAQHAALLAGMPIWAFHGDADTVVPPERSREVIEAIRAAGGTPILTEYPGVGHDSWTPTFQSRFVWDWMFAQRLPAADARAD